MVSTHQASPLAHVVLFTILPIKHHFPFFLLLNLNKCACVYICTCIYLFVRTKNDEILLKMYDRAEHPHNDTISSEGHHQNNPIIIH